MVLVNVINRVNNFATKTCGFWYFSRELCPERVCKLSGACELAKGQIMRALCTPVLDYWHIYPSHGQLTSVIKLELVNRTSEHCFGFNFLIYHTTKEFKVQQARSSKQVHPQLLRNPAGWGRSHNSQCAWVSQLSTLGGKGRFTVCTHP